MRYAPRSRLPVHLCIGNHPLGHFNHLRLEFVETEQVLGLFGQQLGDHGVVFPESLLDGLVFYHDNLAPDVYLRLFFHL